MKILGIHTDHNASVSMMEGGEITVSVQEERLTRNKNQCGYPKNAIEEVGYPWPV